MSAGWSLRAPVRNQVLLNSAVPITTNTAGNPPPRVVAAQLRVSMSAGDVLLFLSAVETRVEMDYAVLSAGFLRYTLNGQFVNPADPLDDAGILCRPMGWNVWKTPHYRIDHKSVLWTAPASGVYVIQHVLYGTSSAYTGNPAEKIDVRYADQSAVVFHPELADPRLAEVADLAEAVDALTARVAALEAAQPPPQ